jgi:fused signal recognition particle receptor
MLIAVAIQFPLVGVAFLTEFSQRKKRPRAERARRPPTVARPEAIERPPTPPPLEEIPPAQVAHVGEAEAIRRQAEAETRRDEAEEEARRLHAEAEARRAAEEQARRAEEAARAEEARLAEEARRAEEAEVAAREAAARAAAEADAAARAAAEAEAARRAPARFSLGLRKTRENFLARIRAAITGSAQVDEIYEGLEEALIGADVGVETSMKIVEAVRGRLKNDARADVIRGALKDEIERILAAADKPMKDSGDAPLVVMLVGVNGVGKTTTVAKLAALMKAERGSVIVAAGDTFRAAAIDQLQIWCDRVGVDLVKQTQGSDPAAVAFDAVKAAVARKARVVLIDTAGRLQTKVNLMEELKKISRVAGRELPGAPHEIWLVLDATTGQNALSQAKLFGDAVPLTGAILAKLDGTAKGGVIVAIADRLKLPVRFVGLGEDLEDLRPFNAHEFAEALFSDADGSREAASGTYAA